MNVNEKRVLWLFIFILLVVGNILIIIHGVSEKVLLDAPFDFTMRYRESKYVLMGINPFDVMQGNVSADPQVGELWEFGGATPWALTMGILVNFCFLSEHDATVLAFVLCLIFAVIASIVIYHNIRDQLGKISSFLTIVMCLALSGWATGLVWINYGCIYAFGLLIACMVYKKHPYLSGFLLALSSMKPQLAIPFYIAFLLKKQWKVLMIGCLIPSMAWIMTCLLTKTLPHTILLQMSSTGESYFTSSLFSLTPTIFNVNLGDSGSDFASVVFVVAFCLVIWIWMRKTDSILFFVVPATINGMWMYTQEHDHVIWALVIIALMLHWQERKELDFDWKKFLPIFFIVVNPDILANFHWLTFGNRPVQFYMWVRYFVLLCVTMIVAYREKEKHMNCTN